MCGIVSYLHVEGLPAGELKHGLLALVDEPMPVVAVAPGDRCPGVISPILYTIPMQLLACHEAALKGADGDQPRNLAKSVTVE